MNLFRLSAPLLLATLAAFATGCATTVEDDGVMDAESALRNAGIQSIEVNQSVGFRPPPPARSCWRGGGWSVNYQTGKLTGTACVKNSPNALATMVSVSRTLTADELTSVRTAVAGVRTTARPAACPTDMPIASLSVKRARSENYYVDARAACGGNATNAVVESTLANLVSTLEGLTHR